MANRRSEINSAHVKRSPASLTKHNIVELTAMVKTRPKSTCGLP
jgi:hypothetical protein